eukprot:CAMPEP_0119048056 /NCGR_PEP_ID=MMETSP1177-20130426/56638_1 /TAXON_ID=2985 /ORGANISM="Ochromonas sp, Strain CCMP1899" /LENGTH=847 /DNA_ID=CAMNT_0007023429 /DNA_START=230 /DNA_END=2770 /DNA_ORIENTATION=-
MTSNSFNQQTKIPNYARSKIRIVDEQEEAMKALVTTLPGADLKFLKKRRSAEMRKKVAVSYYQERLMRSIFVALDFGKVGVIKLDELKGASDYVEMRMEAMSTTRGLFKDIQLKFSAMDTNGDGELDYTEFTIAMTGTENGLLEKVSPSEMDMMTFLYIEYAHMMQRKKILVSLNDIDMTKKDINESSDSTKTGFTLNSMMKRHSNENEDISNNQEPIVHTTHVRGKRLSVDDLDPKSNRSPLTNRASFAGSVKGLDDGHGPERALQDADKYKDFITLFSIHMNNSINSAKNTSWSDKKLLASLDPVQVNFEYRLSLRSDRERFTLGGKKKSLPDGKYIRKKDPRAWDRKTHLDLTPAIDVMVTEKIKKQDIYLKELIGFNFAVDEEEEIERKKGGNIYINDAQNYKNNNALKDNNDKESSDSIASNLPNSFNNLRGSEKNANTPFSPFGSEKYLGSEKNFGSEKNPPQKNETDGSVTGTPKIVPIPNSTPGYTPKGSYTPGQRISVPSIIFPLGLNGEPELKVQSSVMKTPFSARTSSASVNKTPIAPFSPASNTLGGSSAISLDSFSARRVSKSIGTAASYDSFSAKRGGSKSSERSNTGINLGQFSSRDIDLLDSSRSIRTEGGTYTERSKLKKKMELKKKDEILPGAYSMGLYGLISDADATTANRADLPKVTPEEEYEYIEKKIWTQRRLDIHVAQKDEDLKDMYKRSLEEGQHFNSVRHRRRLATKTLPYNKSSIGVTYPTTSPQVEFLNNSAKFNHKFKNKANSDIYDERLGPSKGLYGDKSLSQISKQISFSTNFFSKGIINSRQGIPVDSRSSINTSFSDRSQSDKMIDYNNHNNANH